MATYMELVDEIRDWSNRDDTVISNRNIKRFIDFAADNAYRTLRIAPMEYVASYGELTEDDVDNYGNFLIPDDLIEFIQFRKRGNDSSRVDASEGRVPFPTNAYEVYNSRADIQSFYEDGYWKYGDDNVFIRERNRLRAYPVEEKDIFELYYYRRFPAPYAYYDVTVANINAGVITLTNPVPDDDTFLREGTSKTITEEDTDFIGLVVDGSEVEVGNTLYGTEVANWLRDENEKVLLFGALAEAFDYLDEPDQSQKYHQRFELEIKRLNDEDKMRMGSGGNLQVRYDGYGLI